MRYSTSLRAFAGTFIIAAAALLGFQSTAAAQDSGVFDQPFQTNPFQPMLADRATVQWNFSAGLSNNTFGVGDLWAVGQIADDFSFTDIFLIGGLVPEGEGVKLASRGATRLDVAILPLPMGRLGLSLGGNALAEGTVPDEVAGILRDGLSGSSIDVDFSGLGGTMLAYADVGVLGLFDLPIGLLPLPGDVRVRVGGGFHYLHSGGYADFGFDGADGEQTSRFGISHDGVDAEINAAVPIDLATTGTGYAIDLFAAANMGERIYVGALLKNLGQLNITQEEQGVAQLTITDASFGDFFAELDSLVTDTVAGGERQVTLPGVVRLEGSFMVSPMLRVGAALEGPLGDDFQLSSPLMARVELRPLSFLPIRVGGSLGGTYGGTYQAGLGLDFNYLRWDLELVSQGGPQIADMRGLTIASGFALRF